MKKLIEITLLLILSSCIQTELLNTPLESEVETKVHKPHKPPRDTIRGDTIRIPIGFDVSVEEWEGKDIEL